MAEIEDRRRGGAAVHLGEIATTLVPGPVEYSTLNAAEGSATNVPVLIWLHGGGGSRRFLESCTAQFMACWADRSLPAMVVATPSAGWSYYLDRYDGSEKWETFLLEEFIPAVRAETGATDGPLLIGGISVGALGALRMAFRHPDKFKAVVAIEPTVEASLSWERVPVRDRIHMPEGLRAKLFGNPVDHHHWRLNHPSNLAVANSTAIAASDLAVYLEAGDEDQLHVHYGTELLHRCLFDIGLPHEYRLTRGGNHVGPSVGPRLVDAFRFLGRILWGTTDEGSIDAMVELESFAAQVRGLEDQVGYRRTVSVNGPHGRVRAVVTGEGPPVVLLPSLGRGADDFTDLADRLARAGYLAIAPEPRGWNGSSGALEGCTLAHLADDVAAVIGELADGRATVVGHDFGGQVARALASRHGELVRSLVLLATPGPGRPKAEPATAHRRTFVPELTVEEHLEAVALAFFAAGNDPVVWVDGWNRLLASSQRALLERSPEADWASAGTADTLIVRPSEDCLVSADSARQLAAQLGGRASVVEVPAAGHALLPEQPEAVAVALLTWMFRSG